MRDWKAWQPACVPLAPQGTWNLDALNSVLPEPFELCPSFHTPSLDTDSFPSSSESSFFPNIISIKTNYKPSLKQNSTATYPRNDAGRYQFMEKQRKVAKPAARPENLQDFEEKVRCYLCVYLLSQFDGSLQLRLQLRSGKRERKTQYLHLDGELIDRCHIFFCFFSHLTTRPWKNPQNP